jgi:formylglycine-generating enzyme required for sulfatase activity
MDIFTLEGSKKVPVDDRIKAAQALGEGSDPRIKPQTPKMKKIPGMENVLLGKYPVTVMEFKRFVDNGGYGKIEYWQKGWKEKNDKKWSQPGNWEEQMEKKNHPVTRVSWYEACAYCNWLGKETGLEYRLPCDREWLQAATFPELDPEKREYPWGNEKPDADFLNFNNNVGDTIPVGVYPKGVAYGGHIDMTGNVWEWNYDLYNEDGDKRVIRGGSMDDYAELCRSAIRDELDPGDRYDCLGFRLSRSVTPLGP